MNVIVVADIDWIIPSFFQIREGGDEDFLPATQNVPFILNIIDELAGDDRFMDIRKRARMHRTLAKIDEATTRQPREGQRGRGEVHRGHHQARSRTPAARWPKKIDQVESRTDLQRARKGRAPRAGAASRARASSTPRSARWPPSSRRKMKEIEYDRDQKIRAVQDRYKMYAILIPPIPPLLLALAVFFRRRELERQGVSRERLTLRIASQRACELCAVGQSRRSPAIEPPLADWR